MKVATVPLALALAASASAMPRISDDPGSGPQCSADNVCSAADAEAIVDDLTQEGTATMTQHSGGWQTLKTQGTCVLQARASVESTEATAENVGKGLQSLLDSFCQKDGLVGGQTSAYADGDFILKIGKASTSKAGN